MKIIKKNLLLLIACTAVVMALAHYISTKSLSGYKLEQAFFIYGTVSQTAPTAQSLAPQFYDFDNYYNQEKARNFTDTAVAILQSGDFTNNLSVGDAHISAQRLSPQLIKIIVVSTSSSDTKFILERTVLEFNQKIKALEPQNPPQLSPIGSVKEPVLNRIEPKIALLAGAAFGLALSTFLIALKTYFKL